MIVVLMSTYNGELYLREQIDSIIGQKGVEVRLIVRDDGSSDSTCNILQEYAEKGLLEWRRGENIGAIAGFMALLQEAPESAYYAFADQDDVWHTSKLHKSLELMQLVEQQHNHDLPIVVHTDLHVVDKHLKELHASFWQFCKIEPSKIHCMKENVRALATGCTMLMNKAAREVALSRPYDTATMHDAWVVAAVYGSSGVVAALPEQTIEYRQHGANTLGAPKEYQYSIGFHLRHILRTLKMNYQHYRMLRTWDYPGPLIYILEKFRQR